MRAFGLYRLLFFFPFVATLAMGADLESWQLFEVRVPLSRRLEWSQTTQARTRNGFSQFYLAREQSALRFRLAPHGALLGSYLYTRDRGSHGRWTDIHRAVGGGQVSLGRPGLEAESSTLVERFFAGSRPDYTRYRERIKVSAGRRVSPLAAAEGFANSHGYTMTRLIAGVLWRRPGRTQLEFNYYYDWPRHGLTAERHVLATTIHFHTGKER